MPELLRRACLAAWGLALGLAVAAFIVERTEEEETADV